MSKEVKSQKITAPAFVKIRPYSGHGNGKWKVEGWKHSGNELIYLLRSVSNPSMRIEIDSALTYVDFECRAAVNAVYKKREEKIWGTPSK